jgi:hypothetical protein
VLIDHGDTLLFESVYDGSWENYIDDFRDHAASGGLHPENSAEMR